VGVSVIVRYVAVQPSGTELLGPLAAVVGRNCRDIRRSIGATQDDLARHARSIGLDWSETRVGHFENGRSAPTFATVLAVTLALELARQERRAPADRGISLADLVGSKGYVELTDRLNFVPVPLIADVCRGEPFAWPPPEKYWEAAIPDTEIEPGVEERRAARAAAAVKEAQVQMAAALTLDVAGRSGLTEQRLAKDLRISDAMLAAVSFRLWNGTFSEERDRRAQAADPNASQQKRGRVARELRAELEEALADGG
jgi:transcriptional regulator with XRE-family HTH domain